ncbi:hypothetical protein ACS77_18965 [Pseudomonas syringae]|uniref:Uncharacterized protein n=1 Tax=Pseudomonas syringae TaxID=317 RepID=A0A0L1M8X2_PSESX|nr:hypothetical protein ACS77_18965 [Pseudomonas syringae]
MFQFVYRVVSSEADVRYWRCLVSPTTQEATIDFPVHGRQRDGPAGSKDDGSLRIYSFQGPFH